MTTRPLTPTGLRCAHKVNPLGVASSHVRLSWVLEGEGTGRAQRAYQVLITDDAGAVAWDSGRVEAAAAADVAYGGSQLSAGGRYRWKVRVWDEGGRASGWSEPARFEVELDQRMAGTPPGSPGAPSGRPSSRPQGRARSTRWPGP